MLSETEYENEVREQAENLAEAVEGTNERAIEVVIDVLDAHTWFNTNSSGLSGAEYGAIISDFDGFGDDPLQYRDTEMAFDSTDYELTLQRMAFFEFETDVLACFESGDF